MEKDYIDKKVNKILSECDFNNIYEVVDYEDVLLLEDDLGSMYGFYFYIQKTKIILLNNNLSADHKKIVFAHELGHSVLHTKVNCAFTKRYTYMKPNIYENEANYFAYIMLKKMHLIDDMCIHSEELSQLDDKFLSLIKGAAGL